MILTISALRDKNIQGYDFERLVEVYGEQIVLDSNESIEKFVQFWSCSVSHAWRFERFAEDLLSEIDFRTLCRETSAIKEQHEIVEKPAYEKLDAVAEPASARLADAIAVATQRYHDTIGLDIEELYQVQKSAVSECEQSDNPAFAELVKGQTIDQHLKKARSQLASKQIQEEAEIEYEKATKVFYDRYDQDSTVAAAEDEYENTIASVRTAYIRAMVAVFLRLYRGGGSSHGTILSS